MSSHKKGKRDRPTNKSPLPDLSPKVIVEGNYGPEKGALRLGVKALERVCDQLDEAENELSRHRRATGRAS